MPDWQARSCNMKILFTGFAGDEGARILYENHKEALEKRFSGAYLAPAGEIADHKSMTAEKAVFERFLCRFWEVNEGGVLKTLFDLSKELGIGLNVNEDLISIHQETIEICEQFDINPYGLLSTGCMVALAEDGDTEEVIGALETEGIRVAVIGDTEKGKKKTLYRSGEPQCLNRPKKDPLKEMKLI